MHRGASFNRLRGGFWFILVAAVLTQVGCGSDDDGADDCQVGCEKANQLCNFGNDGLQQCLSECRSSSAEQIQAAKECAEAANTCSDITQCRP
ncbi:MAG: hypothetical protein KC492_31890 [Myxococcales bacterium]|nr:hypothetical protein [Myxococcales bacterium]MCB9609652.1 hypothetical protein [Polyangiaceae bacterium]